MRRGPGALVGTVVATDPDLADPLTYTILSGNTGGAFSIDAATGQLLVANPTLLDFETNPTVTLRLQVTDSAVPGLSEPANVTIQLNDLTGAANPTGPASGGGQAPDPGPDPGPGPTGGGGDDQIDLGGDADGELPVLAAKKRDNKPDDDEQKEDDRQEKRVQRLLDPINTASKE